MKATNEQIAKACISSIMNRSHLIITTKQSDGFIKVNYRIDQKEYWYKVKIENNKVIWGNIDGRWRDHSLDEVMTFKQDGDNLTIIQKFVTSEIEKTFKIKDL